MSLILKTSGLAMPTQVKDGLEEHCPWLNGLTKDLTVQKNDIGESCRRKD